MCVDLCMCVCSYVCIMCVNMCIFTCACSVCVCMCMRIRICMCISSCMCMCICVPMHACIFVCTCMCTYLDTCWCLPYLWFSCFTAANPLCQTDTNAISENEIIFINCSVDFRGLYAPVMQFLQNGVSLLTAGLQNNTVPNQAASIH